MVFYTNFELIYSIKNQQMSHEKGYVQRKPRNVLYTTYLFVTIDEARIISKYKTHTAY